MFNLGGNQNYHNKDHHGGNYHGGGDRGYRGGGGYHARSRDGYQGESINYHGGYREDNYNQGGSSQGSDATYRHQHDDRGQEGREYHGNQNRHRGVQGAGWKRKY